MVEVRYLLSAAARNYSWQCLEDSLFASAQRSARALGEQPPDCVLEPSLDHVTFFLRYVSSTASLSVVLYPEVAVNVCLAVFLRENSVALVPWLTVL